MGIGFKEKPTVFYRPIRLLIKVLDFTVLWAYWLWCLVFNFFTTTQSLPQIVNILAHKLYITRFLFLRKFISAIL